MFTDVYTERIARRIICRRLHVTLSEGSMTVTNINMLHSFDHDRSPLTAQRLDPRLSTRINMVRRPESHLRLEEDRDCHGPPISSSSFSRVCCGHRNGHHSRALPPGSEQD